MQGKVLRLKGVGALLFKGYFRPPLQMGSNMPEKLTYEEIEKQVKALMLKAAWKFEDRGKTDFSYSPGIQVVFSTCHKEKKMVFR